MIAGFFPSDRPRIDHDHENQSCSRLGANAAVGQGS
jgi:hypothetical protein